MDQAEALKILSDFDKLWQLTKRCVVYKFKDGKNDEFYITFIFEGKRIMTGFKVGPKGGIYEFTTVVLEEATPIEADRLVCSLYISVSSHFGTHLLLGDLISIGKKISREQKIESINEAFIRLVLLMNEGGVDEIRRRLSKLTSDTVEANSSFNSRRLNFYEAQLPRT